MVVLSNGTSHGPARGAGSEGARNRQRLAIRRAARTFGRNTEVKS
jgi:hypothetical protein